MLIRPYMARGAATVDTAAASNGRIPPMRGVSSSERLVGAALTAQLGPRDRVLSSIRFSDPVEGDVEIDFLVLLEGYGIAVVEVKGGQVSYESGEWWLEDQTRKRRIHPIAQARKGKHTVRRFLARQAHWPFGMPATEWFLVFPYTKIEGDLGPEGRRELIIGNGELDGLVERLRSQLAAQSDKDHRLTNSSIPLALSLLQGLAGGTFKKPAYLSTIGILGFAALGGLSGILIQPLTSNLALTSAIGAGVIGFVLLASRSILPLNRRRMFGIGAAIAGLLLGGVTINNTEPVAPLITGDCNPNYTGCIANKYDVDCGELTAPVRVIGTDIYRLDGDKDGIACEMAKPKS